MLIPSKIDDILAEWKIRLNKTILKWILSFFLLFFNVATIKFKITWMTALYFYWTSGPEAKKWIGRFLKGIKIRSVSFVRVKTTVIDQYFNL